MNHCTIFFILLESLSLSELAARAKLSTEVVQKRIVFWLRQGVLRQSDEASSSGAEPVYSVIESDNEASLGADAQGNEDDVPAQLQSSGEKKESDLLVHWSFIVGMLTNLGSLPIERIHMMLGMFVQGPTSFDADMEELQSFLNDMVEKEKLDFRNGMYSLRK